MSLSLPLHGKMRMKVVWAGVFICTFVLSIDIWNWNQAQFVLFGFPFWIIRVMILTIILTPLFYWFSLQLWRT